MRSVNQDVLNDIQIIFIVESVNMKNNGITESVLRKIKFIEDNWGHRPILLTANHNVQLGLLESHAERLAQELDLPQIRTLLEAELSFQPPINSWLAASILEKIVVHHAGDRQRAALDIHLKQGSVIPGVLYKADLV
jgi:hypothetical protein